MTESGGGPWGDPGATPPPPSAPYGQPQWGPPPGPYPPQGYPYPPYPPQQPGTNGFAIASLVLGILWLEWVGSILAIIFGFIARAQIKRTGQGGDGLAIAGIVLGFFAIAMFAVFVLVLVNSDWTLV